jgi:hypothetical protein
MAKAFSNTKLRRRTKGGSFVIISWSDNLSVAKVRSVSSRRSLSPLYFKDEKNGSGQICLCDCDHLTCGDDWDRPYIGMKYQLQAGDHIYFWDEREERGIKQYPIEQDEELIENLRHIRPNGGISFIVNQHGIVLVKKELGRNMWKPVYVGKINYKRWFKKEE